MEGLGVIFDMDGVLVDSYRAHLESWRRLARNHGLRITERQFADTFGQTSRDIIHRLWAGCVDEAEIPAWGAEKEALYREILREDFPEMDGAGDLIAALHAAGLAMAIGSSGPPENVQAVGQCLPHSRHITTTVNGHEVAHGKPDPEIFLLAAEKMGLAPQICAVIEDAPAGIEAALRAGMTAIAVTGTAAPDRLARAHLVVDSLRELTPARISELIRHPDGK